MKLLLDQHFSRKLVRPLAQLYPGSTHTSPAGLTNSPDEIIWQHAKEHGFTIVTRDEDFQILSFSRGHPPKVIWVRQGNQRSATVLELLTRARPLIEEFALDPDRSLLSLA